jgi:hypothetical protein
MNFEVKRAGKVEIIKLKNKTFMPERKPSVKRFLLELKMLFPCKAELIASEELENIILKTFGSNYEYHIVISDAVFRVITKEQMEQLLKNDDTDKLPYIPPEVFDCDDFSDVLLGSLTRKTIPQGFAIGQLWYYNDRFGHAVNLFCDGEKIWVVEPQNDSIIEWGTSDYSGFAFLVKF